uniref:Uncharacterized protein n=1 Tax=Meloidogyne javanica TaxID=6303 RepID=A0A915LIY4_MELJA
MPPICSNIFRPMLRPLCRYAHLNGTPGIYNTVPNWKPGPGWRPQSPQGPYLDGWAMGSFPSLQSRIWLYLFGNYSLVEKKEQAVVTLGPQVREGENVFGVAHIFAFFNDTFVYVTDLSGRGAIMKITGGMH